MVRSHAVPSIATRKDNRPTLFVYHNTDARFTSYQDGHHLTAVTSHRLATDGNADPQAVADWAFHTFNADLDQLETNRSTAAGETTFLAACVYRLLGHRSPSVGDVIHITHGENDHWLACEPSGWRPIDKPSNMDAVPPTARTVYERLRSQQAGPEPAPGLFTKAQVAGVVNQAADEILDVVDAGGEVDGTDGPPS